MASCKSLLQFIINLIIIVVFQVSVTAQRSSYRNISLGSSIVANADSSPTWTSPSGVFAFGFRQVAGGGFLLAIWFDQTPNKTVVWSANRDDPVPSGSKLQLSAKEMLELFDDEGRRIWGAGSVPRSSTAAYAAMLDTGNFVIATDTSALLWQSFDSPTDTLLPGQILSRGDFLVSSFSQTNYSRGRFKLTMQNEGNLVLATRSFPLDDSNYEYWSSQTGKFGSRLVFNQSGSIDIYGSDGAILKPLFKYRSTVGQSQFQYQILILEYDGVLRHYHVYPNSSTAASVQDFLPPNICVDIVEKATGGGPCGFNGICTMGTDGRPSCSCPLHYSSRGGVFGCVPDFAQHRCDEQSQDSQNFRLDVMYNVDWPVIDYVNFMNVEEEWCRQSCLEDCYCVLAVYGNPNNCYKKALPFTNGRMLSTVDWKAFIKVRINSSNSDRNITSVSATNYESKSSSTALVMTLSVLLGCSLLLYLLSFAVIFLCLKSRTSRMVRASRAHPAGVNAIRRFGFNELQVATQGFKDELGRGACSKVYKGTLKDSRKVVAVKKLDKIAQESDHEFVAEVSSISRTNHKNLVQLFGYCDEGEHMILVYEFMSNGSLADFLFQSSSRPNWYRRMQIAFAIARGLCYLHEECSTPIIHCDIKPQNVLLDESYTPKISDFGLAKLMRPDQTRTTTGIRGTRGYVAPEWFRNMPITVKVDVYSYGILLLELVCCRKSYEADAKNEEQVILADWAYDCHQERALDALVEGDEEAKGDMKMVERLVMTAIWCIQEDPTLRPHMKRVMHMLEGSIQVPPPPNPSVFIS